MADDPTPQVSFLRRITARISASFNRLLRRNTSGSRATPVPLAAGPDAPTTSYPGAALLMRRVSTDGTSTPTNATATTAPADIPFDRLTPVVTPPSSQGGPLLPRGFPPLANPAAALAPDEASTDPRSGRAHARSTDKVKPPPYDPLGETEVQLQHGSPAGLWFNPGPTALATALSTSDVAMQRAIDLLVRERMVVFDVGAGFGLLSLVAARRCTEGQVYAFEPVPDYAALLERSASRNSMHHLHVEKYALGDRDGEARLHLSGRPGHSRLDIAGLPPEPAGFLPVMLRTVDQVVGKSLAPPPDLLVVDVEGAEASVLRGAAHVLRAARPVVVLSLHGTGAAIAKLLDSFGLDAYALGAGDARPPTAAHRWAVGFPRERVHLQTYVGPLSHRAIVEPDRMR
ncbi:MAG TPA: FkbM family methyltransferase, partial [Myxococcales bacterium]|nr:FkbM family methyltransferase [Myxococcales bacterium]